MGVWDIYRARVHAQGADRRTAALHRGAQLLASKLPDSLSYHEVTIDGAPQSLAVLNSDNLDMKTICSMPGEDFPNGGLVSWMDSFWLITEKDVSNELYTRGTMQQCNYLLRWVSEDKRILERWCIIDDGTKYLTGEATGGSYIITHGDTRISMTIAKDPETIKFGRENRFIIDDYGSPDPLAYKLSKPFKLGGSFDDRGILFFVLQECSKEDTDNLELHIANYYRYFPREGSDVPAVPGVTDDGGKKVWL